ALVAELKATGAPIIYFGTDTATLLPSIEQTRAEVIGIDWRIPIDDAFEMLGDNFAVQGNLDPVVLFASEAEVRRQARDVLDRTFSANRDHHASGENAFRRNVNAGVRGHAQLEARYSRGSKSYASRWRCPCGDAVSGSAEFAYQRWSLPQCGFQRGSRNGNRLRGFMA